MKKTFILLIVLLIARETSAQNNKSTGFYIIMKGYYFNLSGKQMFQPCDDSCKTFFEALDERAFTLWPEDAGSLIFDAADHIGDSMILSRIDSASKIEWVQKISFFPCKIELIWFPFSSWDISSDKQPKDSITYKNKEYRFSAWSIENWVRKILPLRSKDIKALRNYYIKKGYLVPSWILNSAW